MGSKEETKITNDLERGMKRREREREREREHYG
jgi:hypothetical protein